MPTTLKSIARVAPRQSVTRLIGARSVLYALIWLALAPLARPASAEGVGVADPAVVGAVGEDGRASVLRSIPLRSLDTGPTVEAEHPDSASDDEAEPLDAATDMDLAELGEVFPPSQGSEVWQINTRHLNPWCAAPPLQVYQHQSRQWQLRSLDDLLTPFDGVVVVYVHGNRMESCNTLDRGMLYYRCLTSAAQTNVRFIIWSWPSDTIKGQVRDVRVKSERAHAEGAYLGWYVSQLPADQLVSLVGYSYGAKVITSALQMRACGGCNGLPMNSGTPVRVSINAPAVSYADMSSAGRYRAALSQADRVLMLYNTLDPILKRYRIVEKHARPQAIGYTGLSRAIPNGNKVRQIDVSHVVGRSHYEPRYVQHSGLLHEMRQCILWQEMP